MRSRIRPAQPLEAIMSEKTCETCHYWGDKDEHYPNPITGLRTCHRIPHGAETTQWDDDCNNILKPEFVGLRAFVNDASGYHAELVTLANFGCVEHKQ